MNRDVCRHFVPLTLPCGRCRLDPKTLAGILFREHDDAAQALRYAERMARTCIGNMAHDYARAAQELRAIATNPIPSQGTAQEQP